MRVIHVVPHIDEEASGPSYSVPRLCQSLADHGHQVELSCLGVGSQIHGITINLHSEWAMPRRFAISPGLARSLWRKARVVDVVHNHGLWSMVNVAAGWVVPGGRAKLVVSPRGTLSKWALGRSRQVKRLIWPLQRRAITRADLLHATSEAEYRDIRSLGIKAPVCIIPNGIDIPPIASIKGAPREQERTLLFLGRIHPTKAIDRLLHAWKELEYRHSGWRLVIAGRGEARHEKEVYELARSLDVRRVEFPGPLYGAEKSLAYMTADLFVLPTHSENFGMVIAEALAHACPVIVGHGAPWQGVESEGCGWWVSNEVAPLAEALDVAMNLPSDDLSRMGDRGRKWMEREFSWHIIGEGMAEAYRWIINGGERPECIRVD